MHRLRSATMSSARQASAHSLQVALHSSRSCSISERSLLLLTWRGWGIEHRLGVGHHLLLLIVLVG